jgi:hypothetical protein
MDDGGEFVQDGRPDEAAVRSGVPWNTIIFASAEFENDE